MGAALVLESPGKLGGGGTVVHDAIVDGVLELRVGAAVHGQVLGEDVDGLVARAAEPVSEDVSGVAVLHTIVVQTAGVVLGAGGGVGSLVEVRLHHGNAGRRNNGHVVVGDVLESCGRSSG